MPPAQALDTTQPLSDGCHPTLNLSYPILSLSLIFISGSFFAFRSIIRRRRPKHNNAHLCTAFGLPAFPSNKEWRVRNQASLAPTVSTLATQSTIVASSPLHLNVIPEIEPPSAVYRSMNFLCRGLERSLSWGRATIGVFGLAVSNRVFSLFSSPRQQPIGPNEKEDAGHNQHLSDLTDSMVDTDGPEPDIRVTDMINIPQILRYSVRSTNDSQFKTEIPVLPFIILSLPSNDNLVEDLPPFVSLDKDLLSPDGTFRSTGLPALAAVDTRDLDDIRPVLASCLRERRKRPISWPSPDVLATPGMAYWPRWF
jgi:hypothetical protein